MLKTRVIPVLLWKDVTLIKGIGFDSWRRIGTLMPAIKVFNARCVDELILLNITATNDGLPPDYEIISELSPECFVPLTVGGGIREVEHIRRLLLAGADKVAINTAAVECPEIIREGAERFGSQCIVVSIDARRAHMEPDETVSSSRLTDVSLTGPIVPPPLNTDRQSFRAQPSGKGVYECYTHSGTRPTGLSPVDLAVQAESYGAGEILVTSIERDGTMTGYDLDLIKSITEAVKIPVIAGGGAGSYEHLYQAIVTGGASAVAAGAMYQFTEQTPLAAKDYLSQRGIPVRRSNLKPIHT
ncbi:MAG: imidazole glycerol phosphate synthase subunit HisF [Candidatus Riflebacteria bacterium]|nr:imidazole glycerol phosphate synthase subunit HisF [Candidatus Riflebacteria bacterium]